MAWQPDYISVAELRSVLRINDLDDDFELGLAVTAASRAVDAYCGRQFGVLSAAAPRYYTGYWDVDRGTYVVPVDDLMTTVGLVVKTNDSDDALFTNTLVTDTDYRLAPFNAPADGRPWTMLVGISGADYLFPTRERSIEVTATWGWTAVPDEVKQAALIQAARLYKRKDAPFGVAGSPEMGSELRLLARLDPDVQMLLSPLRRVWGAV